MSNPETPTVERSASQLEAVYASNPTALAEALHEALAEHQRLREERRDFEHRANVAEPALTAATAWAEAAEARAEKAEADLARLRAEKEQGDCEWCLEPVEMPEKAQP